jgi:hypothetical protein
MLAMLVLTHALIPVAQNPDEHSDWWYWPVTHSSLLGAIVVALVAIAFYIGLSYRFTRLRQHGAVISMAAVISGLGCAFVVFAAESMGGPTHYESLLSTAGQITAAILVAFVIEQRFAPTPRKATDLDIVGFISIVTGMGVAILGSYPVGSDWQASLGVVACMGAGAGIATLAFRVSEL